MSRHLCSGSGRHDTNCQQRKTVCRAFPCQGSSVQWALWQAGRLAGLVEVLVGPNGTKSGFLCVAGRRVTGHQGRASEVEGRVRQDLTMSREYQQSRTRTDWMGLDWTGVDWAGVAVAASTVFTGSHRAGRAYCTVSWR